MKKNEIRESLKKCVETKIFPHYRLNDGGHGLRHVKYVIRRSLKFADGAGANKEMAFVVAAYHDAGHHIDAQNHEKVSAEMVLRDDELKKFFSSEEINIISEAVYDHRSSLEGEPRSIYGKIVSSADRSTDLNESMRRSYRYRLKHFPEMSLEENMEDCRKHLAEKFGRSGYAVKKMYFDDPEYLEFQKEVIRVTDNPDEFRSRFLEVNKL